MLSRVRVLYFPLYFFRFTNMNITWVRSCLRALAFAFLLGFYHLQVSWIYVRVNVFRPLPTKGHHSQHMLTQKSGVGVVSVDIITGKLCPIPAHSHFGAIMPETLGEPTLGDDWCWRAEAEGEANAGDGHSATLSTQSASE